MIVGSPSTFAIESRITTAYEQAHFLAIGFFLIHIQGCRYGVSEPDATMLACSFGEVENRIKDRGRHTADFSRSMSAGDIADEFRMAVYMNIPEDVLLEISRPDVGDSFGNNALNLVWAPDGDEAFDDGSYVLQFDVDDRVRLIGFRCGRNSLHDPSTLSDLWIASDEFYTVLQQWRDSFLAEWNRLPKEKD